MHATAVCTMLAPYLRKVKRGGEENEGQGKRVGEMVGEERREESGERCRGGHRVVQKD